MGKPNFSDEFKRDAVAQITERGYRVADVSQRLGVSQHSLYAWKRQHARQVSGDAGKDAEGACREEEPIHRGADCLRAEAGRDRYAGGGGDAD